MGTQNAKVRPSADVDDELGVIEIELTKLVRHLETFGRKSSLFVHVDRAGYIALRTLDLLGPSSLNALAVVLHLDSSTVTRQIAVLESSGFVKRDIDPEDRRSWTITLTAAGRRVMHGVEKARLAAIAEMFKDWSREEIEDLARIMPKLNNTLVGKAKGEQEGQLVN
ncbi:MAG: MarR family transcriptional regulator [Acidimicrobiales bacterium]|jgi:DNA-binding MarR family transcriptional regulator